MSNSNNTGPNCKRIVFRPYKENMFVPKELNTRTEEEVQAIAARLAVRHEELMNTDSRYRELHESLPDRSSYVSGLPANVAIMQGLLSALNRADKCKREEQQWDQRNKKKQLVVARARRVQKLLDAGELDKARALVEKYNGENWGQGPKKDPK